MFCRFPGCAATDADNHGMIWTFLLVDELEALLSGYDQDGFSSSCSGTLDDVLPLTHQYDEEMTRTCFFSFSWCELM